MARKWSCRENSVSGGVIETLCDTLDIGCVVNDRPLPALPVLILGKKFHRNARVKRHVLTDATHYIDICVTGNPHQNYTRTLQTLDSGTFIRITEYKLDKVNLDTLTRRFILIVYRFTVVKEAGSSLSASHLWQLNAAIVDINSRPHVDTFVK